MILSATSWWLLGLFTELHWQVLFGGHREGIAQAPLAVLFKMLGQLDVAYRHFALGALAFNVWAFWSGRPRWMTILAFPLTFIALTTTAMIQ
jgi:hypothetical protein